MSFLPDIRDGVIVETKKKTKIKPPRLTSEQKSYSKRARGTNARTKGTNPRAKAKALWREHFEKVEFIKNIS